MRKRGVLGNLPALTTYGSPLALPPWTSKDETVTSSMRIETQCHLPSADMGHLV